MSNSIAPKYGSGNCQSFCAIAGTVVIRHPDNTAMAARRHMERILE